jgi:hypothetical protein
MSDKDIFITNMEVKFIRNIQAVDALQNGKSKTNGST